MPIEYIVLIASVSVLGIIVAVLSYIAWRRRRCCAMYEIYRAKDKQTMIQLNKAFVDVDDAALQLRESQAQNKELVREIQRRNDQKYVDDSDFDDEDEYDYSSEELP